MMYYADDIHGLGYAHDVVLVVVVVVVVDDDVTGTGMHSHLLGT